MAKTYCKILGVAMLAAGVLGFAMPRLMGFHLTVVHNVIHLATGALAAYFCFAGAHQGAQNFCRIFGVVYGLVALLGFVAPGLLSTILGHPGLTASDLMADNVFHVFVALSSLAAGFMGSPSASVRAS
jgi:uncharacterized membrane protein HdeD (DUF308 family)